MTMSHVSSAFSSLLRLSRFFVLFSIAPFAQGADEDTGGSGKVTIEKGSTEGKPVDAKVLQNREAQIELHKELRAELKQARTDHVALKRQIISASDEMSALQKDMDAMQQVEQILIEERPDMKELLKERDAKLVAYEDVGQALSEKQARLERLEASDPEVKVLQQDIRKTEGQRQAAVNQLAQNGKQRKLRVASLRKSNPEIKQVYEQWSALKKTLDEKVAADPTYQQSLNELRELQLKVNQLSRQIMEESR